ncbi:hypothetical protein E2C01_034829 [Portunus trituberculatus]|uniref:Uncharacterized protein n=1 Tax=Portunus trituberculatus TaxID=210409 RepID=A0A5B7F2J0_PORTR|nr:hypothetical protein [Portunus trituberculatus]
MQKAPPHPPLPPAEAGRKKGENHVILKNHIEMEEEEKEEEEEDNNLQDAVSHTCGRGLGEAAPGTTGLSTFLAPPPHSPPTPSRRSHHCPAFVRPSPSPPTYHFPGYIPYLLPLQLSTVRSSALYFSLTTEE